jgi:hypothetical protein
MNFISQQEYNLTQKKQSEVAIIEWLEGRELMVDITQKKWNG